MGEGDGGSGQLHFILLCFEFIREVLLVMVFAAVVFLCPCYIART